MQRQTIRHTFIINRPVYRSSNQHIIIIENSRNSDVTINEAGSYCSHINNSLYILVGTGTRNIPGRSHGHINCTV